MGGEGGGVLLQEACADGVEQGALIGGTGGEAGHGLDQVRNGGIHRRCGNRGGGQGGLDDFGEVPAGGDEVLGAAA